MAKQRASKQNTAKDGINYKKLFFELMAVLTVLFVITLMILRPFLIEKGVINTDKYASHREIIKEVDSYDYSKGRNLALEEKLDKGYENANSDIRAQFYALASGIYYCNIGYYNSATEAFNWLIMNPFEDEKEALESEKRRVLCERKMAREDSRQ